MDEKVDKFISNRVVRHGPGAVATLDEEITKLGGTRVGLLTDPGVVNAGLCDRAVEGVKVDVFRFEEIEPEPSYEQVGRCVEFLEEKDCDLVVAVGGGSVIDSAKMAALMMKNPGKVTDYYGKDRIPNRGLPVIAVPTTAGTGSEVSPACIFRDPEDQVKKGVRSDFIVPEVAILDPVLTLGLPKPLTASTGLDALTHAVEAYTSLNATMMSNIMAEESIRLIGQHIRTAYANGNDLSARYGMLMASFLAGVAFSVAGVAAVHAIAHTLGGIHHIPHGIANALLLPYVMEFNRIACREKFARIASLLGERVDDVTIDAGSLTAVECVRKLSKAVGISKRLRDLNIPEDSIDLVAERSVTKEARLLVNNPREMGIGDAKEVLKMAY
jgi:alcohol dehydrogenase class IV